MAQTLAERNTPQKTERWEPFGEFEQLNERMRRMLEQTFGGLVPIDRESWAPFVDIEEQDDAYVVEADVPGVKREDVKVEQVGNELLINGEIKEPKRKGALRRQTRRVGQFAYRVMLPEQVDGDAIEAKLSDGVLTVRVPKSQRAQRRQIEIKS
jgi:HSP20 family protein